jgi:L-lactate dehydrogenase complex protein LldE
MHIGGTMARLHTEMRPVHIAEILAATEATAAGAQGGSEAVTEEEPSA